MKLDKKFDLYPQATHKANVVAKRVFNSRLLKETTHENTRYEAKIVAHELRYHLPHYLVFRIGKTVYIRKKCTEGIMPLAIVAKIWEIIG